MNNNPRWQPQYDPLLTGMHASGLSDREITGRMLDAGHPVSQEDVTSARKRLGLVAPKPAPLASLQEVPFRDKSNPLAEAKVWLGRRLVEKPGGYFLDGVPVGLNAIIKAYNSMRVASGAEQILTNPDWRV